MNKKKIIFMGITVLLVVVVVILSFFVGDTKADGDDSLVINKKAVVADIKFDTKKVNIYFFWGDGCPHCEEEYEFWDSIMDEYKDKINHIYGLEVWKNKKNAESLKEFAKFIGDEVKGVPYTIIGDKTFVGFDKSMKKQMMKKIDEVYDSDNSYDVYKEMTKNNEDKD